MNFKYIFFLVFYASHASFIYSNTTEAQREELSIEILTRLEKLSKMGDEIAQQEKIVDSIMANAIKLGQEFASPFNEKQRKEMADEITNFGQQVKKAFESDNCNLLFEEILSDNVTKSPIARMKFAIIRRTIAVGILIALQEIYKEYLNETLKLISKFKQLKK